jgi:hypothetical protein
MNDAHRFSLGSVKSFQRLSWGLTVKKFPIAEGGMRFAFPPYRYCRRVPTDLHRVVAPPFQVMVSQWH